MDDHTILSSSRGEPAVKAYETLEAHLWEDEMLNEVEELLIDYLILSKATKGTGVMVSLTLKERPQQLKMCRFLSDNPEATDEEIMAMAQKISK